MHPLDKGSTLTSVYMALSINETEHRVNAGQRVKAVEFCEEQQRLVLRRENRSIYGHG